MSKIVLPYFAWAVAFGSTLGSLYFSEILQFPPCVLCWYQRILMYPLVIIIPIGILKKDQNFPLYVLPLGILGIIVALYHNLLYYNIIAESATPCIQGVSCTTKFIEWFGFVTIPLLSLLSFIIIVICMLVYKQSLRSKDLRRIGKK